jgi:branched-chain amino acid transport system substrate-binding protein
VIIGSGHLTEGIAIIKGSQELGITPQGFGETVAPPTPDFVTTLGSVADGVLGSSQWTTAEKGKDQYFGTAAEYAKDFEADFGQTADYHNAEASASCLAMVLAIQKAGSVNPDKVRDAMAGLDTDSFFGQIKFDSVGVNVSRSMSVVQVQDGKVVAVWPKDIAEVPIIWPGTK